jgi:hypothetical protein
VLHDCTRSTGYTLLVHTRHRLDLHSTTSPDRIRIPDQIGTSEPSSELQINMAAVSAMRTMFVCIGFTNAAAQVIIKEQGMDTLEEIQLLTDDKIENL